MKTVIMLALLTLAAGCELYSVTAHFAGSNQSNHTIQFIIESKNAGPRLGPNAVGRFDASVLVSSQSNGMVDPTNKTTNVNVQVFDLTENRLIQQTVSCLAGQNILSNLTYIVYPNGGEQIQCNSSY